MTVGTKSLLFGVHQVILHPILIFFAWWRLYGVPWDPRLWVAFVVHDWGYWGCSSMDSVYEGEQHPKIGARVMQWLFDCPDEKRALVGWYQFMLTHSRFLSARLNIRPSRLCWADKLVITMYPKWLYWVLSHLSGEIHEYITVQKHRDDLRTTGATFDEWWEKLNAKMYKLCKEEAGYGRDKN